MNYDLAYELVEKIKKTDEYKNYVATKEQAFANDLNAALVNEMRTLQRIAQSQLLAGNRIDDVTQQKLKKISETLQFNKEASAFLLAEYNFNKVISDVYKIIADGVGINLNLNSD